MAELAEIDQVQTHKIRWSKITGIRNRVSIFGPGSESVVRVCCPLNSSWTLNPSQSISIQGPSLKHPLNSSWTLWFYKNESRNWEENQRQVSIHNFMFVCYAMFIFAICLLSTLVLPHPFDYMTWCPRWRPLTPSRTSGPCWTTSRRRTTSLSGRTTASSRLDKI